MADAHTSAIITLGGDYVPEPPSDWPEGRKARYRAIVASHPAGWWTEASEPLLQEYVQALEMARQLQRQLDQLNADEADWAAMREILTARDREVKRAIQLARAMRLAQQTVAPTAAAAVLQRGEMRDAPWDQWDA
jgi:hypothetical protein